MWKAPMTRDMPAVYHLKTTHSQSSPTSSDDGVDTTLVLFLDLFPLEEGVCKQMLHLNLKRLSILYTFG